MERFEPEAEVVVEEESSCVESLRKSQVLQTSGSSQETRESEVSEPAIIVQESQGFDLRKDQVEYP